MDNGTILEWSVLISCLIGLMLGGAACGATLMRLIWRYRQRANGIIRLIAWERYITSLIVVLAVLVGVGLGFLLVLAPATDQEISGEIERWARETARWYTVPALLVIVNSLTLIAAWNFTINWMLEKHFMAEMHRPTANNHPHRRHDDPPPPSQGVH